MLSYLSPASVFLFDEETEDSSQQPDKPSAYAALSVLVVDDDFLGREVASCFLETLGVGSISIAVNGFEGLRMLTTHAPSLVLMDLVMPAMDGFACVRRLRAWEKQQGAAHVRVVAVSSLAECPRVSEDCLEAGFDDVVPKPLLAWHMQRLLAESA